jgi:hypothetical protein
MSDFDTVLERLLTDQAFVAAMASDPSTALAGYRLSTDEVDLLRSQISLGTGTDRQVETRTSKAGLLGLLSPLEELAGRLADDAGISHALGGFVAQHTHPAEHIGTTHPVVRQGFGAADPAATQTGAPQAGVTQGFGAAPATQGFGVAPPPDYHPHVDVNGDGHWDQYTVERRADGGIDIYADMNHDGRPDFIGHDDNADGIIDRADYDHDFDGRFETHMRDVNGDGWLDTRRVDP